MKANDRIVDDHPALLSTADMTIDNGFNFGPATRAAAWAFIAFGLAAIYWGSAGGIFLGGVLALAGIFALTSKNGVQVCYSNGYIREFTLIFGFKSGKWIPTNALPDITVIRLGRNRNVAAFIPIPGGAPVTGFKMDASLNEVYLLTADHRKRVLIKVCQSAKEGFEFAKELADKMEKKLVPFNPKISEATQAVKARRR